MKKNKLRVWKLSIVMAFTCCLHMQPLLAQDANYWSGAYSTAGFIAPGAVIFNNRDSGVYYYNPALLALSTKNTVSVTANLYQLSAITLKNGFGSGSDLKKWAGSYSPIMVAGTITLNKDKPLVIGYSLQKSTHMNFDIDHRENGMRNVLEEYYSPGEEFYIGQITEHNRINQTVGQVSLGKKVSDAFSIGLTLEGLLRNQNFSENFSSRAIINNAQNDETAFQPYTGTTEYYETKVLTIGARAKLGASYDAGRHHFGLLLTSPMLNLHGSGTVLSDLTITNLHLVEGAPAINQLGNNRQSKLKSRYKTPFSAALGYAYDYGRGQISLTSEYFSSLDKYDMITLKPLSFLRPDDGSANSNAANNLRFMDKRKSVINLGIGSNYRVNEKLTTYLALRTDFTYFKPDLKEESTGYYHNTSLWNIYHLQLGANIKRRKFNLRTGLLLSYGSTNNYEQTINFSTASDQNVMVGNIGTGKANNFAVGLMIAYIHNL